MLCVACGTAPSHNTSGDPVLIPLFNRNTEWTFLDAQSDPFAHERPSNASCSGYGFYPEDDGIEVETGSECTYASAQQPLATPIRKGDQIQIILTHTQLKSFDAGTGHVAIWLDGRTLWEYTVAIPALPEFVPPTERAVSVYAPADVATGKPLVFHIHNHGVNTWKLLSLNVVHQATSF